MANKHQAQNTPEAEAASKASIERAMAAALGLPEDTSQCSDTDPKQFEIIMETWNQSQTQAKSVCSMPEPQHIAPQTMTWRRNMTSPL